MARLTIKQRAKVNAALSIIYAQGHDVNEVARLAADIQGTGHDERTAYERALNRFADSNPDTGRTLSKITQLIEASDAATVALYDQALSTYIESGDEAALISLAPMIAADSLALAVQSGELSEADVTKGGPEAALGFQPSPLMASAVAAVLNPVATSDEAAPAVGLTTEPPPSSAPNTGYRSPQAQARWEGVPYTGPQPSLASHGLTPAAAREAAKAAVMNNSRAIIPETPAGS